MSSNIDCVLGIYEAFGRGDVAQILDRLSDDVSWDEGVRSTQLRYLQPGVGKAHVVTFFQALAETVEFTVFEPSPPCASQDTVMVAVREAGRNLLSGAPIVEDIAVHIWTFDADGKVSAFRHVGDFAIHEAAAGAVSVATVSGGSD